MKRILFVTNHLQYSDGVVRALTELVNALDKTKYEITIMPIYKCDKNFLKNIDPKVIIKPALNFYFRGLPRIVNLISKKFLYKLFVKEKYDIEVAYQFGVPTSMIASSQNKEAMHIAWIHGLGLSHLKDHESFDKIICCSKSSVEKYTKDFKYPERVSYLYNLVNDDIIINKSKEQLDVNKNYDFTFCTVGRLSEEKGFMRLLKCHKKLMDEGLVHNLWIIGDGPERNKLQDYVKNNGLENSVVLFGQDNNPYKYMANADMFVCSSYSEGFSTVCVESAIIGKSIITTEVGGAKEFVEDNKIGIMVQNNEQSLYDAMKYILNHKEVIQKYEENLKNVKDMHYKDRLQAVEFVFGDVE